MDDNKLMDKADELAVNSRVASVSCVDLRNKIYTFVKEIDKAAFERGVEEAAKMLFRGNATYGYYSMGPDVMKEMILSLKSKPEREG